MTHPSSETVSVEETRQRIIRSAMQLFAQVGYAQASTRRIAQAAAVNEVTLFRHFGSKKNLLLACIEAFNTAGFAARFETVLTGSYPEDILRIAILQNQETSAGLEVLRLMLCDARNMPELRQAMLSGGQGNLSRLSAYFQGQIDAGILRADLPAEVMAAAFDSLFSSPVIFENLFQGNFTPGFSAAEAIQPLVDLFVQGTLAINHRSKP